eukprot:TRINITY_DN7110_c2_g1_i1.p1 TRINITY_DN7110_c2_g1~~TRINITY_DN7110_c2_g1_i1.p1  ORF type:complete len:319 (+),score=47.74 TRINITY_DN7110_c2_g1_i1:105-1061(+)
MPRHSLVWAALLWAADATPPTPPVSYALCFDARGKNGCVAGGGACALTDGYKEQIREAAAADLGVNETTVIVGATCEDLPGCVSPACSIDIQPPGHKASTLSGCRTVPAACYKLNTEVGLQPTEVAQPEEVGFPVWLPVVMGSMVLVVGVACCTVFKKRRHEVKLSDLQREAMEHEKQESAPPIKSPPSMFGNTLREHDLEHHMLPPSTAQPNPLVGNGSVDEMGRNSGRGGGASPHAQQRGSPTARKFTYENRIPGLQTVQTETDLGRYANVHSPGMETYRTCTHADMRPAAVGGSRARLGVIPSVSSPHLARQRVL